jgi:hemerythrin
MARKTVAALLRERDYDDRSKGRTNMQLLEWKEEYSVGIEDVDYEHKELIDIINRLHEELLSDNARLTVPHFFAALLNGVSAHFALEERVMDESNYAGREMHKEDHERLLEVIRDVQEAFVHSEEIDSVDLALRLQPWFTRHFATHDTQMHRALARH